MSQFRLLQSGEGPSLGEGRIWPALPVRNLLEVFGDDPARGISLYREGRDKDEVVAETGMTIGVCDANFSVREGEFFLVMGLSGSGKSTPVRCSTG